jgi:hypothetical protein
MYVISAQVGPCTPSWDGYGRSSGSLTLSLFQLMNTTFMKLQNLMLLHLPAKP